MDYLEGMLIHSWWSDTDYANRKHNGTWYFYSFCIFLALAYAFLKLNLKGGWSLANNVSYFNKSTLILFFITPLLCAIYYRLPLFLRIPTLIILAFKYLSFFIVFVVNVANMLIIPENIGLKSIIDWGNKTVGDFLTETTSQYKVSGLFLGGIIISLIVLAVALVILLLLIYVPMLMLHAFNLCQMVWDKIVVFIYNYIRDNHIKKNNKSTVNNLKDASTNSPKSVQ